MSASGNLHAFFYSNLPGSALACLTVGERSHIPKREPSTSPPADSSCSSPHVN